MTSRNFRDELGKLPPDLDLGTTPEKLMSRGRRIKMSKQGLVVSAAALAVVGITTTATTLGSHTPSSHVVHPAAGGGIDPGFTGRGAIGSASSTPPPALARSAVASRSPSDTTAAAPAPTTCVPEAQPTTDAPAVPTTTDSLAAPSSGDATNGVGPTVWGNLINVGTDTNGKQVVVYGYPLSDPQLPCTHFGLMLAVRSASTGQGIGQKDATTGIDTGITGMYATNEFAGSDLGLGFHGTGLYGGGNQVLDWYVVGYYVGPAASITLTEDGVQMPATVAPWSVNPNVKIWWVSGKAKVPAFGVPSAKDANGKPLPAGTAGKPALG